MDLSTLCELVYDAGIIGAGGAGFPTHKKFSTDVKQIVVNAAECEPLMMVDHHLLEKHLNSLVYVLNIILDATGAEEAIIGIKGKNMHLLNKEALAEIEGTRVSVKEIPDIYPAGDEVVMVYETTGKIVPEGCLPASVGVIVLNAETLYNIYKRIHYSTPVVEKYVTIGGDTPIDFTVKVPVGMKISELLAVCGYSDLTGKAVINGGPMMGRLVNLDSDVVTKTTKGLLIFPEEHSVIQRKRMPLSVALKRASAACCNCTMCSDMCPRRLMGYNLEVHRTVRSASHCEVNDSESFTQAALCCGCGICTVIACQQMLNPQAIATAVKGELGRQGYRRQSNNAPDVVRPERKGRLVSSDLLIDRLGIRRYLKEKIGRDFREFNPERVYIALSQHVGKPASPIVKVGDSVSVGDAVARTEKDALGTTMHSSINGRVLEINDRFVVIGR